MNARSLPVLPRTRGECVDGVRPCPRSSCRHHLAAQGKRKTSVSRPRPVRLVGESCSLDVADRGPQTHDEIGALLGMSHGRTQQIVDIAFLKLRRRFPDLRDQLEGWTHLDDAPDDDVHVDDEFRRAVDAGFRRVVMGETAERASGPHVSPWRTVPAGCEPRTSGKDMRT